MPNSNTFSIKPIRELICRYAYGKIIDPFANNSRLASVTNDLDPQFLHTPMALRFFRIYLLFALLGPFPAGAWHAKTRQAGTIGKIMAV